MKIPSENATSSAETPEPLPIGLADIEAAAARIAAGIRRTPASHSPRLSAVAGCALYFKFEIFQFTASFKERGALNKLLLLTDAEKTKGVITVSAGNHAQAVAHHASRLGVPATVVMPRTTAFTKVTRTEALGARVILGGESFSEAAELAERVQKEQDLTFVHPFEDKAIIAGQGTAALEFLTDFDDLDVLVVPVGGGGLNSGCATAAKALCPGIEVVGVQSACYPAMIAALEGRSISPTRQTVADGIAVKAPGRLALRVVRALVDEMMVVEDGDIERAVCLLTEIENVVAEGAGAAALAAVLASPDRFRGKKVGVVLSGANIDSRVLAGCLMRGLLRDGRMVRLYVKMEDVAGSLAKVATVIGRHGGNILEVLHHRMTTDITARYTGIEILVETKGREHTGQITGALEDAGFQLSVR
jgi:threonine dehydratase